MLAELETIRGHLVSASASTDNDNREQLTATVRALRDETHALSAGTMAAYGEADLGHLMTPQAVRPPESPVASVSASAVP